MYKKILFALAFVFCLFFSSSAFAEVFIEDGLYGIKDYSGRVTVPPRYEYIYEIPYEGLYIVQDRYEYILLDRRGRAHSRPYDYMSTFSDGYLLVRKRSFGDYGLIDYNGYEVIPCQYNSLSELGNNLIIADYQGYEGIIDYNNNIIISFKYRDIDAYDSYLLKVKIGNKYGLINFEEAVVLDIIYDDILNLGDEIAAVKQSGLWGALALDDTQIVPVKYKKVQTYKDKYIKTKSVNNFYGLYSRDGKQILADKYSKFDLNNGYFIVKEGKLYGLVNANGQVLTTSKYNKIKYDKKTAKFKGKIDKNWYYINIIKKKV